MQPTWKVWPQPGNTRTFCPSSKRLEHNTQQHDNDESASLVPSSSNRRSSSSSLLSRRLPNNEAIDTNEGGDEEGGAVTEVGGATAIDPINRGSGGSPCGIVSGVACVDNDFTTGVADDNDIAVAPSSTLVEDEVVEDVAIGLASLLLRGIIVIEADDGFLDGVAIGGGINSDGAVAGDVPCGVWLLFMAVLVVVVGIMISFCFCVGGFFGVCSESDQSAADGHPNADADGIELLLLLVVTVKVLCGFLDTAVIAISVACVVGDTAGFVVVVVVVSCASVRCGGGGVGISINSVNDSESVASDDALNEFGVHGGVSVPPVIDTPPNSGAPESKAIGVGARDV